MSWSSQDMSSLVKDVLGRQGLSQDFRTGCPTCGIIYFFGFHIFKEDHNIFR